MPIMVLVSTSFSSTTMVNLDGIKMKWKPTMHKRGLAVVLGNQFGSTLFSQEASYKQEHEEWSMKVMICLLLSLLI